ncbi:hypothetical protein ACFVVX_27560 [Kitasatospora sp. NPDC058170]|uniref:hypothetical protein n=1 Tax=Kitasatospora sp. NPDC058170 TaxID=3346364 RepID=UPI0036DF726B
MVLVAPPMKLRALTGGFKQFLDAAGQLTVTGGIDQENLSRMTTFDSISMIKEHLFVLALTSIRL